MEHVVRFASGALACGFTNTQYWTNMIANSGLYFITSIFVRFVKDMAALGVTNECIVSNAAELRGGDFASIGAVIAPVEVLYGKFKLSAVNLQTESLDCE
jgi:hypothetical protein